MKRCFLLAICCCLCSSSLLLAPTTARAQDRAGAEGPERIKAVLLRPSGWKVDWKGPAGDDFGEARFTYEARADKVVVRIQQLSRSDRAAIPECERPVTIAAKGATHDGCIDFGIELIFDPKDQDSPFKGKSPRGYRYALKAG
jgi:hypothetical protein